MRGLRVHAVAACVVTLALCGCGKDEPASAAPAKKATKAAEERVPPYTYPAPVKGHFKEINIGAFDVVDGIAFPDPNSKGTVIYVTSKPIASPVIATSACPMTQARALSQLRDASFVDVTILNGKSKYFAAGTSFGGSMREEEVGGHYWTVKMKDDPDSATGHVYHKQHASFDFDLPLSKPLINEVSQGDWVHGTRADPTMPRPTEQAVTAAYKQVHDAALRKDLKALLSAQGFDAKQIASIRGLEGIDADLGVYSDRFLKGGEPGEFASKPGTARVRVEGTNARGKKFVNFYHFMPCGQHLVLASIAENPQ
jgi:hypothetical protein